MSHIGDVVHSGVKGMHWGVRRDNSKSSHTTSYKTGNIDKFGTGDHNALYVTGLSGSGKTTFADELAARTKSEVIHLDTYFEKQLTGNNKSFTDYLEKNGVVKSAMFNKDGKLNYSVSDKVLPLIKSYKKKVIVEGVQIFDNTLSDHTRDILRDEPIVSLQTSIKISTNRAIYRDKISETKVKDIISWAQEAQTLKSDMEKALNLSIGKYYVDQMI